MPKSTKNPSEALSVGFLFDDTLDSNAGVAQYVKTLGAWLYSEGHEVSYLVGQTKLKSWSGGSVYSLSKNVSVTFNANRLSIPLPAPTKKINKLIASHNFDVLHVQVPHSPFLSQKVINRVPATTAVIGTFHILPSGVLASFGSRLLRIMYGRGLKRFDRIVSVSRPAADFAQKAYKIHSAVLPNVVDLQRLSSKSTKDIDILFLGRLVPRKGAWQLLKAFEIVHSHNPDLRLVIAGDGPQRAKLERFVHRKGLLKQVDFRGIISEADKPKLLASAKIACFPSLHGESFGIVLLEAIAAGAKTVLAGDNPGYRSVLGGRPLGLIDPRDSGAFSERLEQFLEDGREVAELSAWQQSQIGQYDVLRVGPQLVNIYRQAIVQRYKKSHNVGHEG